MSTVLKVNFHGSALRVPIGIFECVDADISQPLTFAFAAARVLRATMMTPGQKLMVIAAIAGAQSDLTSTKCE